MRAPIMNSSAAVQGFEVHYVAEQFSNDGSLQSNLMKNIKRSMAGEYSRELSVKVFAGQCRLIEKGYRQGGPAGYGLRRMLIDEKRGRVFIPFLSVVINSELKMQNFLHF